ARMHWAKRQAGLRAFQRLALTLLVAAQHQRPLGRLEIESDHVPKLLLESWIVRQLERLDDVRLQVVLRPDALHAARRDAGVAGHAAHAPAASPFRRTGDLGHDALDLFHRQRRLAATPRRFFEASKPARLKAFRPGRDALRRRLQSRRYLGDADAFEPQKNDLGAFALTHQASSRSQPAPAADELRLALQATGTTVWEMAVVSAYGLDNEAGLDLKITELASTEAGKIALIGGSADVIVSDWLWVARERAGGHGLVFYPASTGIGAVMTRDPAIR